MESGSHALTLGRLYAWEKKLFEEVKVEYESIDSLLYSFCYVFLRSNKNFLIVGLHFLEREDLHSRCWDSALIVFFCRVPSLFSWLGKLCGSFCVAC